jgi:hypothetical protein
MKKTQKRKLFIAFCLTVVASLSAGLGLFVYAAGEIEEEPTTLVISTNITSFSYMDSSIERIEIGKDVTRINFAALSTAKNLKEIIVDPANNYFCNYITTVDDIEVNDGILYSTPFVYEDGNWFHQWGEKTVIAAYPVGKTETTFKTPDFVTTVGSYAFARQSHLTSVEFSGGYGEDGNAWGVQTLEDYIFFGSAGITKDKVKFPVSLSVLQINNPTLFGGYDGSKSVTVSGDAVIDDASLTKDTDGRMCVTINKNISNHYFNNSAVERIYIGKDVTELKHTMFSTARSLREFSVDGENTRYMSLNGVLYEKDAKGNPVELVFYPIGKEDYSYQTPDTVTAIGPYGLARQRNLVELRLSGGLIDTGKVDKEGNPITEPWGLQTLNDNCFFNSTSIKKWDYPASIVNIASTAYNGGVSISYLLVSDTASINKVPSVNITTLEFLDGVTEIKHSNLMFGQKLQEIIIPASVTEIEFIYVTTGSLGGEVTYFDNWTFADNTYFKNLTTITVAEDNTVYASDGIGIWEKKTGTLMATASANTKPFMGTKKLYWETPAAVTKIAKCGLLLGKVETVKIGKNVTEIEEGALRNIDMYNAAAIKTITVEEGNNNFISYDGVLFSKDMIRLVKYPSKHNLSNIFLGSATYEPTRMDQDYGLTESQTHYFSDCYIIPKTVKKIDSFAFEKVSYYDANWNPVGIKYLYIPAFDYNTQTDGNTANYVNDHVIKFGEESFGQQGLGEITLYLPIANKNFYLYKHDEENKEVSGSFSDFSNAVGINTYNIDYVEDYSSSIVQGEGDPFMIKYGLYGTSEYVKPVA